MAFTPRRYLKVHDSGSSPLFTFWTLPLSFYITILSSPHTWSQNTDGPVTSILQATSTLASTSTSTTTSSTSDSSTDDWDNPVTSYYYAFFVAFIFLIAFVFWLHRRRRRARKRRAASSRQNALLQDAAGWPRSRYLQHSDGATNIQNDNGQAIVGNGATTSRRWAHGNRLSGWGAGWASTFSHSDSARTAVLRDEGLDERGEAPPPYKPPERHAEPGISTPSGSYQQGRQASVAVTDLAGGGPSARVSVGKPPDYAS